MVEWLKEILGEDLDESKMEKIKEEFPKHAVPKDQYNKKADKAEELESELNTAKEQLDQTNEKLTDLQEKAENAEDFKEQLDAIKSEYDEYKEQEQTRINQIKKKSALEKKLLTSKVPEDAVDLVINDFDLDELELDDDGNLKNIDEQMEKFKERRPSLIPKESKETEEPSLDFDNPDSLTQEQLDQLSDEEYMELKKEGKI
ncbi:MAG: phage scaffolding protein [Halanaerobiales bacterium]